MKKIIVTLCLLLTHVAHASSCATVENGILSKPAACNVKVEKGVVESMRPVYIVTGAYTKISFLDRNYVYDGSYRQMTLDGTSAEDYARDLKGAVVPFDSKHFKKRAAWQCFKNDDDDICWRK